MRYTTQRKVERISRLFRWEGMEQEGGKILRNEIQKWHSFCVTGRKMELVAQERGFRKGPGLEKKSRISIWN